MKLYIGVMKITGEKIEISRSESVSWKDVKQLRLLNNKLALVLVSGRVIEVENLRPTTIDTAFRLYESYLKEHPEKRQRALGDER